MTAISRPSSPVFSLPAAQEIGPSKTVGAVQTRRWIDFVPVITTIALAALLSSSFTVGLAIGFVSFTIKVVSSLALDFFKKTPNQPSPYQKDLDKMSAFSLAIKGPVIEELIFRGCIQTGLKFCAKRLLPVVMIQFCIGPPFALATAVAVVATASLFGLIHYFNPHPGAGKQAFLSGCDGVVLGALMVNYGIMASFASHILNNTLCAAVSYVSTRKRLSTNP